MSFAMSRENRRASQLSAHSKLALHLTIVDTQAQVNSQVWGLLALLRV